MQAISKAGSWAWNLSAFCIVILSLVISFLSADQSTASPANPRAAQGPEKELVIKLWAEQNKTVFVIGEVINFKFQASKDCYVTLIDIGTDGLVHQLFPNKWHPDNRVEKGKIYTIPPAKSEILYRIGGPEGTEVVKAVATLRPVKPLPKSAGEAAAPFPTVKNPQFALRDLGVEMAMRAADLRAQTDFTFRVVSSQEAATRLQSEPTVKAAPEPEPKKPSPPPVTDKEPPKTQVTAKTPHVVAPIQEKFGPDISPQPQKSLPKEQSRISKDPSTGKQGIEAPKTFKGIVVSLRVMQKKLKECKERGKCPDQILQFCGMKKVLGYVVDKGSSDIILVGDPRGTSPPLRVEDFIVALKNVGEADEPPGCSIDPNHDALNDLQELSQKSNPHKGPAELQRSNNEWKLICSRPQDVRVMGVPFDSRFAKVMVDADYYMKRLVDGSVTVDIRGFKSLTQKTLDIVKKDLEQGKPVSIPPLIQNRFWFAAGDNTYLEDDDSAWIKESKVKLLTEENFLTQSGTLIGSGKPHPLAQEFAEEFSAKYSELASKKPIYTELEGLYRFVALARIMKQKNALKQAGVDIEYLLTDYTPSTVGVAKTLPGIANFKDLDHAQDRRIYRYCMRNCGGVSMDIPIHSVPASLAAAKVTEESRHEVIRSRPSTDSLYWHSSIRIPDTEMGAP